MVSQSPIAKLLGVLAFIGLSFLCGNSASARENPRFAQIVVDADTHEVIYEENAQALRRPASITKVMTLYLLFDALQNGTLSWNDPIVFSTYASRQVPSKLGIEPGGSISIQTAIEALVVRSANDVAAAVAERIGGSEPNFASMMTAKARELGMKNTTFGNASGLPHPRQFTTAEDLARLAIAIRRDFPDQYHWFSTPQMVFNGRVSKNHNHLMGRVAGMDGLKTGYTANSGFNLAATTQRGDKRIVTIVMGGITRLRRDAFVEKLTESAFLDLGVKPHMFAQATSPYAYQFRDNRDGASSTAHFAHVAEKKPDDIRSRSLVLVRTARTRGFDQASFMMADLNPRLNPTSNDEDIAEAVDGDTSPYGAIRASIVSPTHSITASNMQRRPNGTIPPDNPSKAQLSRHMTLVPINQQSGATPVKPDTFKQDKPFMVFPAAQMATQSPSYPKEQESGAQIHLALLSPNTNAPPALKALPVTGDLLGEPFKAVAMPVTKEHTTHASKLSKREDRERNTRATAVKKESERQMLARKTRGDAIVQVGAFRNKKDAKAALAQFSKHFPSFAEREISSFKRKDGVWYRARFAGLGTGVARDACRIVSGRGGTCKIVAL
ncbi:D-alanyl-D-alanine carboxypeptidase [Candidatus Phycosocius spiralis]|uniref:SPOR domain-containing protein n=1 Tax=Candidatus Phycosocius spiralis TaxID=2815099 RepID=A0ABQ4PT66_9PROT|nr:D-alanyl-D-alanine carboxypeptidase [Candidatus Phycosocius spiralis]GIU66173.1 hypothetical protein PsB1_0327 [Candidatus Phycosocius spiralis]